MSDYIKIPEDKAELNPPILISDKVTRRASYVCPSCGFELQRKEGCLTCPSCGYSKCS